MAKKATDKPAAKAAAKTAAKPAAKPLSPGVVGIPLAETPPGVSGVLPLVAPLSDIVVLDEQPPEIVVGSEGVGSMDDPPVELEYPSDAIELPPVAAKASLEDHPAIELAQSFMTPHGKPETVHGNYYTPPPPELRKPVKA
jgi:hypothetical protein